jgi:hypothetical protein
MGLPKQSAHAYNPNMTLVIDHLPESLTLALHDRAKVEGRSVQEIAMDAMARGLFVTTPKTESTDLSRVVGTWQEDPEFDDAMSDFERVDPEG